MKERLQSKSESDGVAETLAGHDLPASVAELVDRYEAVAGDRDRFLWKWLHHLVPELTLSCTEAAHRDRVRRAKLLASMYVVLLDDLAEKHRDGSTFEQAAKVPFDHQTATVDRADVDAPSVRFAGEVWSAFERDVADAPRHDEFADVLRFDVKQNLNAVEHSFLLNRHPDLGNLDESTMYDCHNMMLLTYADVDLMHARPFDRADLGALRRILLRAQEMLRIGNWITTWERELEERDFSSGVLVKAVEAGVISTDDLGRLREDPPDGEVDRLIAAIHDERIEDRLFDQLHTNYEAIEAIGTDVSSIDVDAYLNGVETVLEYHFASKGMI